MLGLVGPRPPTPGVVRYVRAVRPRVNARPTAVLMGMAAFGAVMLVSAARAESDPQYARAATSGEAKAIESAAAKACAATKMRCAWDKIVVGRRSSAPHSPDVLGWASIDGQAKNCPDGCYVQVLVKRLSSSPLRFGVRALFGPTGGAAGECVGLARGAPPYIGAQFAKWHTNPASK